MAAVSAQRLVAGAVGSVSWQPIDSSGEPTDPGVISVSVTTSSGDSLVTAATASGAGSSPRTVDLTVSQTSSLDLLTAAWQASGVTIASTLHEIVGGVYASVAAIRAADSSIDAARYPTADVQAARVAVEQMFEEVTGVAWVPRFAVERLAGVASRCLVVRPMLRAVAWARLWRGTSFVTLDAAALASILPSDAGLADRLDGGTWACDVVEIGYSHGYDRPPADLAAAVIPAIRRQLNLNRSGLPDRATSQVLPEGGMIQLATPGMGRWHTGIPDVDEVLNRYDHRRPAIA